MSQTASVSREFSDREFVLTDRDFRNIVQLVRSKAGIALGDHKRELVYGRLSRRLRALKMRTFSDYLSFVESDAGSEEIGNLINAITTNLTAFFRESHHLDHLGTRVVAPLAQNPGGREFLVWSAGCSTGEEPYSIAMTIADHWPNWANNRVRVLATDLDTNALGAGRNARYAKNSLKGISPAYRQRFLKDAGDSVEIVPDLRKMITFKQLNLQGNWPMRRQYDVIFCRNVMIYFDDELKTSLLAGFHARLKPGGYLYIGHSESAQKYHDGFELVGRTIYERLA